MASWTRIHCWSDHQERDALNSMFETISATFSSNRWEQELLIIPWIKTWSLQFCLQLKFVCIERERVCERVNVRESACERAEKNTSLSDGSLNFYVFENYLHWLPHNSFSANFCLHSLTLSPSASHTHTPTHSHSHTHALFHSFSLKSCISWQNQLQTGENVPLERNAFPILFHFSTKNVQFLFLSAVKVFFVKKRCKALNSGYNISLLDN